MRWHSRRWRDSRDDRDLEGKDGGLGVINGFVMKGVRG